MKRLKLLLLVFFVAISVPLAFVIWQTYAGLAQEERGQLEYFSEALFDQMEKELASLIQEEENRAVDEYQYFLAQPFVNRQGLQQISPLAQLDYGDYVLGYLQNNPDGTFQTPLVADMGRVPEDKKVVVLQLAETNRIFNNKKYSLPQQKSPETEAEKSIATDTAAQDKTGTSFSERYLTRSKEVADKTYLGKKQQRVEEISAEQAFNVSSEDQSFGQSSREAGSITTAAPSMRKAAKESKTDLKDEQIMESSADAELLEQDSLQSEPVVLGSQQLKFQVEVAPFQSVAIKDDQIYIFRRIAINNQIFRQGFILLATPFLEHLVDSHFIGQPLAAYTEIRLQRMDQEENPTIVEAGAAGAAARFITKRVFPAPFDFLSVSLSAKEIPPSPARGSLRVALVVLGVFMFLGLLAIYQSARTIVVMSERRSQFVSSVTHELKTPLTNIRMYIEMLEQGIASSPEREQEYLTILNSESARLSGLINNVLELAKLEKKQRHFDIQEGQFTEVLTEVKRIMDQKLKQEGFRLDLQVSDLPLLTYDRDVLIQILINLIENSIKFGRQSASKKITIKADAPDRSLRIAVSDSGPGIPQRDLKKIFEDFYRVDNDLTRLTGGTGIGLALVKKFITAMGGRVYASNNDGPGCTITFILPVKGNQQA